MFYGFSSLTWHTATIWGQRAKASVHFFRIGEELHPPRFHVSFLFRTKSFFSHATQFFYCCILNGSIMANKTRSEWIMRQNCRKKKSAEITKNNQKNAQTMKDNRFLRQNRKKRFYCVGDSVVCRCHVK